MIGQRRAARRLRALTGGVPDRRRAAALLLVRPRLTVCAAAALAALVGLALAGPVAALVAGVYASLATGLVQRREQRTRDALAEAAALDAVVAFAADLRTGQPTGTAWVAVSAALGVRPGDYPRGAASARHSSRTPRHASAPLVAVIRGRVRAAVQIAEVAGAPLADLLDRLDADVRARRAVALQGAAHAAGATATSWLLTALPVAGVGLGYGLGADPQQQLLHTPLGAGCVALALALQLAGLAWVARIARAATEVAG